MHDELVVRSVEASPFWWQYGQVLLQGRRSGLPATAAPRFASAVMQAKGSPGAMLPWSTEPPPDWSAWIDALAIWPYRSTTDLSALAVTSGDPWVTDHSTGVCVRLRSWACAMIEHLRGSSSESAPVRAEQLDLHTVAVEIAALDDKDGWSATGTAELHVFALDPGSGALERRGALILGGLEGTQEQLGMYRGIIDLDYRFVRRAYQRWTVEGACVRVEPPRGGDVALGDSFEPLSDLLARRWRESEGALPKPRKPKAITVEQALAVKAAAAVLPPEQRSLAPGEDASGLWKITGSKLERLPPGSTCEP
ncbi:hypothetical protein [Nannocystis punicea]|uniref:Uncharacterized protein n=1 Tax=Nannocystis punicea TaxID=2995304 RepID=A0ABY7H2K2_9BACT|nr:hypothetical protein [Nannocystis poenicansa]WAS93511.1 hypothetical protein O0S08_45850 [Nannocystis poenicansa]